MKLMSFWSKFFIALAITILATTGAVVGVFAGQKEQIDMGGSIKYTVPYFTVEFLNYDDTVFETQQVAYGHDAVAPSSNPTRTGYTFKGWTDYTNITGNRRVASQWEANKYHVTYSPNGGTGNNYVVEVTYEQPFIALDVTDTNLGYTRTGYTFSHWTESSNGGTSWDGYIGKPWTWTYTHDITLYAQWTANKYHVTYNPNGGTGNDYVVEVTYGQPFVCLDNTDSHIGFTKKGHSFSHWIGDDGSNWNGWVGKAWTWAYAYDVIMYAQWSPNTYTVKYDANGGSGTMSDTTVKFGENITISANTYTRVGYTYDRWLEQYPDGMRDNGWTGWSGQWRWDDGEYSITNRTLTLYASWTLNNSYLRKDWQTALIDNNANFTAANIKTIQFVNTVPSGSGYTQVSVGATTSAGTTAFVSGTAGVSDVIAYVKANGSLYDVIFYSPVAIYAPVNSSYLFSNSTSANQLTNLTSISFGNFNTSNVTNMQEMFYYCSSLTSLDLSNFDTSNVTDMELMFCGCSFLTSLDVSTLDTSKVTNMRGMFQRCSSLTSLNVSSFNTSKVTTMSSMFFRCSSLTSLNVSNFDTSNVTDMFNMFRNCSSLTSLNLSSFDMSKVTRTNYMFTGCAKLTEIKTPKAIGSTAVDLPTKTGYSWLDQANTNNAYTQITSACLSKTLVLRENNSYLRKDWQTALKNNNSDFTHLNIKTIQFVKSAPSNPETYTQVSVGATAADGATAFVSGTAGVSDVIAYVKANSSDSTKYDVIFYSPVTIYAPVDSSYLFSNSSVDYCFANLTSISFGNFNTSKVTNMKYMFAGAGYTRHLTSLDLSCFDTSNVTDMYGMFFWWGPCSLTSINLSSFNTSKVTNMSRMFFGCNITSLNISNFNTSNVTNMDSMFYACDKLTSLNLSSFDMSKVTNTKDMLASCSGLTEIKTPKAIGSAAVDLPTKTNYSWFDQANTNNTYTQITPACTSKTLVLYENSSYLRKDWKTALKNTNSSYIAANIKTIQFVNTVPSGSGYTQVSVGATAADGATAFTAGTAGIYDVIAYVKANSSDSTKYDIIFYSPATIFAPINSSYLFYDLTALSSITLENLNTSNVTDMLYMFFSCSSLTSLDVSSFNTSKVTNMAAMFGLCTSLTSLDVSNFNTSKVTEMGAMFAGLIQGDYNRPMSLTSVNISSFDTSKVTNMDAMFNACPKLTTIYTPKTMKSGQTIDLPSSDWYNKQTGAGPYSSITSSMVSSGSITLKRTVTVTRTVTGTSASSGMFDAETTYNGVTFKISLAGAYGYWSGSVYIGDEYFSIPGGHGLPPTNLGPLTYTSTTGYTVKVTKTGTSVTFVITY